MTAIELAYKILKLHNYEDWEIKIVNSGGALCMLNLKEIWIDEASKDDIFLLLHEIAHIKYGRSRGAAGKCHPCWPRLSIFPSD